MNIHKALLPILFIGLTAALRAKYAGESWLDPSLWVLWIGFAGGCLWWVGSDWKTERRESQHRASKEKAESEMARCHHEPEVVATSRRLGLGVELQPGAQTEVDGWVSHLQVPGKVRLLNTKDTTAVVLTPAEHQSVLNEVGVGV